MSAISDRVLKAASSTPCEECGETGGTHEEGCSHALMQKGWSELLHPRDVIGRFRGKGDAEKVYTGAFGEKIPQSEMDRRLIRIGVDPHTGRPTARVGAGHSSSPHPAASDAQR